MITEEMMMTTEKLLMSYYFDMSEWLKGVKTVNIDIWNIWHMTFTGAIAYAVTGNFAIGIGGVVVHAIS